MSTATLILLIKAENKAGAALGALHRDIAAVPAVAAVAAVGVAAASVKMAADYQKSLTQVANNTTMGARGVQQMDTAIKGIARSSPASLDSLAQGYMHITNLGFGAADATKILDAAQKSAVSTGGDVGDTANVLANVLHEYGMGGRDAAGAMDVLHLAAAQGNMTLSQLVESGGKSIAMAANLHVPLTQVTGALAALTRHGQSAAQASTLLVGMMSKIVNPAKSARTELAALSEKTGIDLLGDFSAAGLKSKGLSGVLADMRAAHLSGSELFKIIPALRGGLGAQILTGTGAQDYSSIQKSLDATLAGKSTPTANAYAASQKTLDFQVGVLKNNLKLLAIAFGTTLLPMVTAAVRAITAFVQSLSGKMPGVLAALRAHLGGTAGVQRLFNTALHAAVAIATGLWAGLVQLWGQVQRLAAPLGQVAQHLGLVGAGGHATDASLRTLGRTAVQIAVSFALFKVAAGAVHAAMTAGRVAMVAWNAGTLVVRAATAAWTGLQWLLNAALAANPIALVVIVIAALVAAVVIAYTHVRTFREWVNRLWSFITGSLWPALVALAGLLGGAFKTAWTTVSTVAKAAWHDLQVIWQLLTNSLGPVIKSVGDALSGAFSQAWTDVQTAAQNTWTLLQNVWEWLNNTLKLDKIGQGIKDSLGGAFDFVRQKIDDFIGGFENVLKALEHLPGMAWIKGALASLSHAVHHAAAQVDARGAAGRRRTAGGPGAPSVDLSASGAAGRRLLLGSEAGAGGVIVAHGGSTHHHNAPSTHHHHGPSTHHHGGPTRHHLTPAQQAAADAVLNPPPHRTTAQQAAIDFSTALGYFQANKGLDPADVKRMQQDIALVRASDPVRAAKLQQQLTTAQEHRNTAIRHAGAVAEHHRQVVAHHNAVVAQRAAHHREVLAQRAAHHAQVVAHHKQVQAEKARKATVTDDIDRFKTDLITLGTTMKDHARLIADVTRIKGAEVAAHYRGAKIALDLAENMKKVAEHFKIIAAARQPVAPVPRYGALAGETGYGQTTVSFGGAQANPWQSMVAALREQVAHLRAQLAKDDQLIALLEVGNATGSQQLGVLRSIDGHVIPGPPTPQRSAHSVLKRGGSYAPVVR